MGKNSEKERGVLRKNKMYSYNIILKAGIFVYAKMRYDSMLYGYSTGVVRNNRINEFYQNFFQQIIQQQGNL